MLNEIPVSLRLPLELKRRAERSAKAKRMALSTMIRAMLAEKLDDEEQKSQLSRTDVWQQEQAWQSAKQLLSEKNRESSLERLQQIHRRVLAGARRARR